MARVVYGGRHAVMDPLKHSQPLGGVLAFLGVARCLPLLHGAQGCAAFAKALLTRHFREPIPMQTSALTEVSTVLGGTESLRAAIDTVSRRYRPDIIGVLTTGVTEVSGEDLAGALASYPRGLGVDLPVRHRPLVVAATTPDFVGGLSEGWSTALTALVTASLPPATPRSPHPARSPLSGPDRGERGVALLVGASLTAVDVEAMTDLVRVFGSRTTVLPDLSRSMDGHLAPRWSPLTTGGTTVTELGRLPEAGTVLAIGVTAAPAATALAVRTGADLLTYDHCTGLAGTDAVVGELMRRTGRRVPRGLRHWRRRLADGLLDSHFVLGGARIAVAGEPEQLAAVASLLDEVGARIVAAVAPQDSPVLRQLPCDEVVIGDLVDLADRSAEADAELVIGSSRTRALADRIGAAHLAAGFPQYDTLGAQLRGSSGYQGSLRLLFEMANRLLDHRASGGGQWAGCGGEVLGAAGRWAVEELSC